MEEMIFLLTRPLRGATVCLFVIERKMAISTHTPLAGRDVALESQQETGQFLLTRPLRGATRQRRLRQHREVFLLTRPLRGATLA